ncbi:hypothetical protein ACFSR9_08865 [Deinococcus taklimakanensis]|uniref:Uncharacterized protein n=1 Tax=Deinococcus taklimakanensis TaxID=536443 RepID=A0ABW5P5Q2_9DEIO
MTVADELSVITEVEIADFLSISTSISDMTVRLINRQSDMGVSGDIVSISHSVAPLNYDRFAVSVSVVRQKA